MKLEIKTTDKILVIAPHPDDEVIACGGFISKYHNQIDVLCVNSSGIQYKGETQTPEEIAQIRCDEFKTVMKLAGVNKIYIEKLWGRPVMIDEMEKHLPDYMSNFNMKDYDIILVPHKFDNHPEHRFVGNVLLKTMMEKQGYKKDVKILRYELWSPLHEVNYYEDISNVLDKKRELILAYKIRNGKNYVDKILALNNYRTLSCFFGQPDKYVEAFYIENLKEYMQVPDVFNKNTELGDDSIQIASYLEDSNIQERINELGKIYADKKIAIYGAGLLSQTLFKNYDLSGLNIVAVADKRFEEDRPHEFFGVHCIKPDELRNVNCDVIITFNKNYGKFYNIVRDILKESKNNDLDIIPLIKHHLENYISPELCKNKVCSRPFHVATVLENGEVYTCCSAYINNYSLGNVKTQQFNNIWNNKRANFLRKSLSDNDYSLCDLDSCLQLELMDKNCVKKRYINSDGTVKAPDQIYMGWDYDCNVACITCRDKLYKNDEKTLERLKLIENEILEACKTAKLYYTSGNGDPFGSKYARELIKKVIKVNPEIKFYIHTNGILCTEKTCEELGIKNNITNVIFSIHASCEATYNKIVRYGNFNKVIENLKWISDLKKQGQIKTFTLAFVVHKLNYQDMPDFVKLAEKYNVTASFRHYRQWSNNTEYQYSDMAVFEKNHPEYDKLKIILKDDIFNSKNCILDNLLKEIKES